MKDGILVSSPRLCILKAEGWVLMMLLTWDSRGKDTKDVSLLLKASFYLPLFFVMSPVNNYPYLRFS